MSSFRLFLIGILVIPFTLLSCGSDDNYIPVDPVVEDPVLESPVNYDLAAFPFTTLSEYNFFEGNLVELEPVYGVIPYNLNSGLFTDYAHKKRFVWMPDGSKANYVNDYSILDFPLGTILIKNFYYDNVQPNNTSQVIETRLQIKKEEGWVFANYVWNEEQTEATFDLNGSFVPFQFMHETELMDVNYRIPSGSNCLTCHKSDNDVALPIGPKPQNLNKSYNYSDGSMNQLQKWIEFGYLEDSLPEHIVSTINWEDEALPLDLRVRSYLDINCAHCHADERHCDYRPVRFEFNLSEDISNLGVCIEPHEVFDPSLTYIVNPGNAERSVIATRINSTEESIRMPLLGRTITHIEGAQLIEEWINSLTNNCE
ncbi:MAG: hypothetical protein BM564_11565 [Bacteroidetes bacterium MedPE-SWsnd-G2]|nr:MAG: hypothetical protein BM564_11565 [Bacteroidetes bacterium MedPE-SWsnd-G2]